MTVYFIFMRVLLLENDYKCAAQLSNFIRSQKIECHVENFAKNAYRLLSSSPRAFDIVVVDLGLVGMSGHEFIQQIRKSGLFSKNYIPIVVLSGQVEINDKILALLNGADYFLSKPYNPEELLLIIVNLISRMKGHCNSTIKIGGAKLDLLRRKISIHDQELKLTCKEYNLLEYLMLNKGTLMMKKTIMQHLYAEEKKLPTMKIADVLICKIRNKIAEITKEEYISTCWGLGYRIDNPINHEQKVFI